MMFESAVFELRCDWYGMWYRLAVASSTLRPSTSLLGMAESNDDSNSDKKYYRSNRKNVRGQDDSDSESDNSNPRPDIGLGSSSRKMQSRKQQVAESFSPAGSNTSTSDVPTRREDNPFSFKHFLNRDACSSSSQSAGGARPKVFSQPSAQASSSSTSSPVPAPRLNPELTSGLPDFVQDHLVIEQCYLQNSGHNPSCQLPVDLPDNLPDFAPVNASNNDQWSSSRHQGDLPFDLTSNQRERSSDGPPRPLDLPETLPFDLPAASGEVGASKSLPDFLSDGPIHSERRNDSSQPNSDNSSPPTPASNELQSSRLQMENERLRRELENARRQLNDQIRRNDSLEMDLITLRSKEHEDTAGLERVIAQIEENLKRTRRRATNAEDRAEMMEKEIKMLRLEVLKLRSDTGSAGACSSGRDRTYSAGISRELRTAASSAEVLLRQLLSGVDNLRLLASTLENRQNVEEIHPDFSDRDTLDEPGPAL